MEKKKETTLRCVLTLTVIAVVCGLLLAVLYPVLYVAPSVDILSDNISARELGASENVEVKWLREETLNEPFVKAGGGSVVMAAKCETGGDVVYGILVKTKPAAKLGECKFSIYIRKSDNKLIKGVIVEDGSTSGKSFDYALENDKDGKVKTFDYYYKIVDKPSNDVYGAFDKPKCGATYTVTAVDNAFRIAADYYYNTYGGGAK